MKLHKLIKRKLLEHSQDTVIKQMDMKKNEELQEEGFL